MRNFAVLTTINKPTKAIEKLHNIFGSNLIVVGDIKTPLDWNYKDITYIPARLSDKGWFQGYDPINHYARKNLGYLEAIREGAKTIIDCDDDTYPNERWKLRSDVVEANVADGTGWFNVYGALSDDYIWARGFSLCHVREIPEIGIKKSAASSIQQGLVDGDPDVDAIWRLILKVDHNFTKEQSIYLNPYSWCPFNSQATQWYPKAYPLMYLPVYSPFRMCDIWRSFVGQRCLWEIGEVVTFHSPSEYIQERNEHDLIQDLVGEIKGYEHNDTIVETLSELKLKTGEENICSNMLTCYESIVDKGILPEMEILSLKAWIKDYEEIKRDLARVS